MYAANVGDGTRNVIRGGQGGRIARASFIRATVGCISLPQATPEPLSHMEPAKT